MRYGEVRLSTGFARKQWVAGGDVVRMQGAYISESEIEELVIRLRGGRKMENGGGKGENGKWKGEGGRGKIVDFVKRFRERRSDDGGGDGRGGHNRKDPTEEMIAFAMVKMLEEGEVTPYAVQKFHQDRTGSLCSRGRAERAIAVARNRAQTANSKNGKGETGTDV